MSMLIVRPSVSPVHEDQEPNVRRSDPVTSHAAADRSASTRKHVADAVFLLVMQEGELTGSELNRLYALRQGRNGWPVVHFDSPRKRAGELARDGVLAANIPDGVRGHETVYDLPERAA